MAHRPALWLALAGLLLAACETQPPIVLEPDLRTSPELEELKPSDVAVLAIEDATSDSSATPYLEPLRENVARALAQRRYAPLAREMVDARVRGVSGSPVDAGHLKRLSGRFEEQALLGMRIDRWNTATLMQDGRVDFALEVILLASDSGRALWSGRVRGEVKAGGSGPVPIGREARLNSVVQELATALIEQLPRRTL